MLCSFCLLPGGRDRTLVAGPGVAICAECARLAIGIAAAAPGRPESAPAEPPWAQWTDEDVLGHLPEAAAVAQQVEATLAEWVGIARLRKISWQRIGDALGMTRQSAWERFRPVVTK